MLFVLALTAPSSAAPTGYPTCPAEHSVKIVNQSVHVPSYLVNAQRGDVVLTSGGNGIPREILTTLGQNYNHALLVSQQDDGQGNTTFTHDTAIAIGRKSVNLIGQVHASILRRTPDGNRTADPLDTLLNGHWSSCNDDHDMAYCESQDATSKNIWRGDTLLLRPNPAVFGTARAVAFAEATPEGAFPYSVGAYTDYTDALYATGDEAPYGPGTMCSGFVYRALNQALDQAGVQTDLTPAHYTEPQRIAAANALYNKLRNQGLPSWTADQVVSCFAWAGDCAQDNLDALARVYPGTGDSVSPDDVKNSWTPALPWYSSQHTAQFAGGYSYDRFSHYECCNDTTGQCYRVEEQPAATPLSDVYAVRATGGDGSSPPPGHDAAELDLARDRADWVSYAAGAPGVVVESDEELCWVTDTDAGRLCTSLVDLEEEPELRTSDPTEQRRAHRRAARRDPSLLEGMPVAGDVVRDAANADGGAEEPGRLTLELEVGDTVCQDASFVAHASAPGATRLSIDGSVGSSVAVTAGGPGPQMISALAFFADGSSESWTQTIEVVRCDTPALRVATSRSTQQDATVRFSVRPDRGTNGAAAPAGTTWTWDFGDGDGFVTTEPRVRHSYAFRDQDSEASSHLVRVDERRRDGTVRTAYATVRFANPAYSVRHAPVDPHWEMPVEAAKRPVWTGSRMVFPMDVRNLDRDHALELDEVKVTGMPCGEGQIHTSGWAADVLDTDVLEAGATGRVRVRVPLAVDERICRWTVTLSGRTGDVPATATTTYDLDARDGDLQPVTRNEAVRRLERLVSRAQADRLEGEPTEPGTPSVPSLPNEPTLPDLGTPTRPQTPEGSTSSTADGFY